MIRTLVACTVVLGGVLGCSSPAPAPTTPTTPNTPPTTEPAPTPTTTSPMLKGLGEPCGADDTCPDGQSCLSYYGIAGPRGPQLKSCEIGCPQDRSCPGGLRCVTIADGPGQVCRPGPDAAD